MKGTVLKTVSRAIGSRVQISPSPLSNGVLRKTVIPIFGIGGSNPPASVMSEKIVDIKIKPKGGILFEWNARWQKVSGKYILGAGILALLIIGYFIWQKNYFGALVIFLCFVAFYLQYGPKREESSFALKENGIRAENSFFEYKNLKNFSINYQAEGTKELKIISKKKFMPEIVIPIGNADPTKIREIILKFLPEKE